MNKQSEVSQMLNVPLQELGCSEQEIEVYTTSLILGPSPIQDIAARLNIARPNIYKVIRELEAKGLAKFSDKKKYARNFHVVSPTVVLEQFRAKERTVAKTASELSMSMPDIMSLYTQGDMPAKVKVFEGGDQFLKVFWSVLEESTSPIRFMGSAGAFIEFVSWDEEKKWIKERVRRNLFINVLLLPDSDAQSLRVRDEKEMRETRFLEDISPFVTGVMLFGNKVTLWQPKAPSVVLIEDEFVVQMMRSIFDRLWETAL